MPRAVERMIREVRRLGRQAVAVASAAWRHGHRDAPARPAVAVPPPRRADADPSFPRRKARKLERIRPLLAPGLPCGEDGRFFDFLTTELRREFAIVDTENVSAHDYDSHALRFIRDHEDGWILDCGAGLRPTYYDNVVNFEICPYATTDVRGVGERLPFRDGVFDAVFSFAVLEHVKDPFACAREMARVLKPGGRLYCVVPFLQPFHAYPHHYYNMSHMGLRNLFADTLEVESQEVNGGGTPIFTLTWILRQWLAGLPPETRRQMEAMRVADLAVSPLELWDRPFVTQLPPEKNFELASTTSLFARKPAA